MANGFPFSIADALGGGRGGGGGRTRPPGPGPGRTDEFGLPISNIPTYPLQPDIPGVVTTPFSKISVPSQPTPEMLGTTIPADVEELARQLTEIGQRDITRGVQEFGLNFGGGDLVASARDRAMALLASELHRSLLGTTLGLRSQAAEATRGRTFDAFVRQLLQAQALRSQEALRFADITQTARGARQQLTQPTGAGPSPQQLTPAQLIMSLLGGV